MTDRLSNYGHTFQIKVITSLLTDKSFLQQISDIIDPKYFESEANNWIVRTILAYFSQYSTTATLEVMKAKMTDIKDDNILYTEVKDQLREALKYVQADDLPYIKEETLNFCKNQALRKAIIESADLIKHSRYDDIKHLIDTAMKAGADTNIGHNYIQSLDDRYEESIRDVIPTPWDAVNDLTEGGLGKGELGVIVAPAGIGKCVGPNTSIDIEYEQIGIEVFSKLNSNKKVVLWLDPWEQFEVDDGVMLYAYQIEKLISLASDSGKSI